MSFCVQTGEHVKQASCKESGCGSDHPDEGICHYLCPSSLLSCFSWIDCYPLSCYITYLCYWRYCYQLCIPCKNKTFRKWRRTILVIFHETNSSKKIQSEMNKTSVLLYKIEFIRPNCNLQDKIGTNETDCMACLNSIATYTYESWY